MKPIKKPSSLNAPKPKPLPPPKVEPPEVDHLKKPAPAKTHAGAEAVMKLAPTIGVKPKPKSPPDQDCVGWANRLLKTVGSDKTLVTKDQPGYDGDVWGIAEVGIRMSQHDREMLLKILKKEIESLNDVWPEADFKE